MAVKHAKPSQCIQLQPAGQDLGTAVTTAIVKHDQFEVIRLVIPEGHKIPPHRVSGPITVQCLAGSINFTSGDNTQPLQANDWLYLEGDEMHSLEGIEDAMVLVTILFPR
jgi:quercetin dioxygenase-like cupin family protein